MQSTLLENQVRVKERRLTRRIQKIWKAEANGGLPSWCDMKALDLGKDWDYCFAADLRLSDGRPYFIYLGDVLCQFSDIYLSGRGQWERTLLDSATAKMDEAALAKTPITYGDILRLKDNRRVVFRSVLLPLAENGVDVTHVFGAASGKKI